MKKALMVLLFILCSITVYSQQTWTETSSFGGKYTEWMVITRDEWTRLRKQREEDGVHAELLYIDSLEMKTGGVNRVLSGTRPNFNGYYYLYGKWFTAIGGWELILAYGNSNTGRMEIKFPSFGTDFLHFRTGTNEYTNLYNRYIRRVNGE